MVCEGKVYRPWPEVNRLLIQTTLGCTRNRCTFCDMFRKMTRDREVDMAERDKAWTAAKPRRLIELPTLQAKKKGVNKKPSDRAVNRHS
jgi:hypothetical protein